MYRGSEITYVIFTLWWRRRAAGLPVNYSPSREAVVRSTSQYLVSLDVIMYSCGLFIVLFVPLETTGAVASLIALPERTKVFFSVSLHAKVSVHQFLALLVYQQRS